MSERRCASCAPVPVASGAPVTPGASNMRSPRIGCVSVFGVAAALIVAALAATMLSPPRPLLVWNASPSSPVGLYLVNSFQHLRRGDMVVAWAPDAARATAAERGYLPSGVPLVKQVAAVAGDRVCGRHRTVLINGHAVALRLARDALGRPMHWWSGCRVLGQDELLLLSQGMPAAFDGRYFGAIRAGNVIGSASLLWAR